MSDAPRPDDAARSSGDAARVHAGDPRPTMDELDAMALDAVVRTAPRYGRFIGTGIAVGVLLGVILGFALPNSTGVGRGLVALLLAIGFAIIGGLTASVIVVGVDRSSNKPDTSPFPWEGSTFEPAPPLQPEPADGGGETSAAPADPSGGPTTEPKDHEERA